MEAWHVWLIAGLVLCLLELVVGSFALFTIGLAAASTAVASVLGWTLEACLAWWVVLDGDHWRVETEPGGGLSDGQSVIVEGVVGGRLKVTPV
jgi:membrane protein implicated in regulation of membrane protease activity